MTAHCKFRVHADRASRYSPDGRVIVGRDAAVTPAQGSLWSRSNDLSAGFAVVQSLYVLGSWREIFGSWRELKLFAAHGRGCADRHHVAARIALRIETLRARAPAG